MRMSRPSLPCSKDKSNNRISGSLTIISPYTLLLMFMCIVENISNMIWWMIRWAALQYNFMVLSDHQEAILNFFANLSPLNLPFSFRIFSKIWPHSLKLCAKVNTCLFSCLWCVEREELRYRGCSQQIYAEIWRAIDFYICCLGFEIYFWSCNDSYISLKSSNLAHTNCLLSVGWWLKEVNVFKRISNRAITASRIRISFLNLLHHSENYPSGEILADPNIALPDRMAQAKVTRPPPSNLYIPHPDSLHVWHLPFSLVMPYHKANAFVLSSLPIQKVN